MKLMHPAFDANNRNLTASTQQLTYQLYAPSLSKFNRIIVFSETQKNVLEKLGVPSKKQTGKQKNLFIYGKDCK